MFRYVNLMIIKLLMMKLHAQLYIYIYIYIPCVFTQLVEYDIVVDGLLMNSYLICWSKGCFSKSPLKF